MNLGGNTLEGKFLLVERYYDKNYNYDKLNNWPYHFSINKL